MIETRDEMIVQGGDGFTSKLKVTPKDSLCEARKTQGLEFGQTDTGIHFGD